MSGRGIALATAVVLGLVLLGFYDGGVRLQGQTDGPRVFVASDVYAQNAGEQAAARRRSELTAAIVALREQTGSGWVGRQDDVTGWLGELSGGVFRGGDGGDPGEVVRQLFDGHGAGLFGVPTGQLRLPDDLEAGDGTGSVTRRATQHVDGVEVVDAAVAITVREADGSAAVTAVRGRVFPGLGDVGTTPAVDAGTAAETVPALLEGAQVVGEPELVVLPTQDGGRLAWRMTVVGGGDDVVGTSALVFVGADDGGLLEIRPLTAEAASPRAAAGGGPVALPAVQGADEAAQGSPVQVTGNGPLGEPLTAVGSQLPDGTVVLRDTTTPAYDAETGRGVIATHDGRGLTESDIARLPGPIVTAPGGTVQDAEALAAHVYTRYIFDFLSQVFGRSSWDGQGAPLVSSVNFGPPSFCNAFWHPAVQQMVYGQPCVAPDGSPASRTLVDIDVAAHEVTHGVIDATAKLTYSGQSGAMNESFADYLGNLIGMYFTGRADTVLGEGACAGLPGPTRFCDVESPDGLAVRDLMAGHTFADYLYLLHPRGAQEEFFLDQDNGGVHLNSAIWNNALWSIRTRLAQIDGGSALDSPRARQFDGVVYRALTEHLTPNAGFLDARSAIEQAASGGDPVVAATIREVFDQNRICPRCAEPDPDDALPLVVSAANQHGPSVSGDRVAWLEFEGLSRLGRAFSTAFGAVPQPLTEPGTTAAAAAVGDATVTYQVAFEGGGVTGRIVRHASDGSAAVLQEIAGGGAGALVGSPSGVAWVSDNLYFMNTAGQVTAAPELEFALDGFLTVLAVGDGVVAFGTTGGQVALWEVGAGGPRLVDTVADRLILSLAVEGGRVLALATDVEEFDGMQFASPTGLALLYEPGAAEPTVLSESAVPFGAALAGGYAVWPESVGTLGGGVATREGLSYPDTDLYLHSLRSRVTYRLLARRGQQAFPALEGSRLVWTDSSLGSDDVFTAVLPPEL